MRGLTRGRRVWTSALGVAVALSGCASQRALPAAPSDLAMGAITYESANFSGPSAHVAADIRDLKDVDNPCFHNTD